MEAWVVWSERGSAWLISGGQGYSHSLVRAGLFSEDDAKQIADRLNAPSGLTDAWAFRDPLGRQI